MARQKTIAFRYLQAADLGKVNTGATDYLPASKVINHQK
jgi:hypothetical protein